MKRPAALISSVLTGSLVFVGVIGLGQSAADEPEGGPEAAQQLSCASNDLIYMYEAEPIANPEMTTGAETPQEGLSDLVEDQLSLESADFEITGSDNDEVEFVDEVAGLEKATALTELTDGEWLVTSFSACNEFLKDEQSASEGGA